MGQKVNPFGFRLGVYEDWVAHWYAKGSYGKSFLEDYKLLKEVRLREKWCRR